MTLESKNVIRGVMGTYTTAAKRGSLASTPILLRGAVQRPKWFVILIVPMLASAPPTQVALSKPLTAGKSTMAAGISKSIQDRCRVNEHSRNPIIECNRLSFGDVTITSFELTELRIELTQRQRTHNGTRSHKARGYFNAT